MIQIFVINLLRDIERRKYIASQLEKAGLEYEFFEAVDKRDLRPEHYAAYNDEALQRRIGRSLTDGELACVFSHAEAWKVAAERDLSHALFLEDDAELSENFADIINNLDNFPEGWNVLNFCTTATPVQTGNMISPGVEVVQYEKGISGTVAYCASRDGLKTMLEHVFPIKAAADGLLSSLAIMKHLVCYGTLPQLAKPSDKFTSSIWKTGSMKEKLYYIKPTYAQRREPVQNFMDNIAASAKYQLDVYKRAREHYKTGDVLDIGCGVGDKLSAHFPADVTLGLDLDPVLSLAKSRHPERKWSESNFNEVPQGKFSVVISADVIEHIFDPDDMLDFIDKIDFDLFVMSTPDRDTLPFGLEGPPHNPTHYREWNQSEFRDYIGSRFSIVDQYQCKEPGYFSQVIEFTKRS